MIKPPVPSIGSSADFLLGGGEMGERMRAMDWSTTNLGPAPLWPQSLKTAVRLMLASRFPILIWWGRDLVSLYNDAYARMTLGAKHPWALGRPAREVWSEIWAEIGPRIESVIQTGHATWDERLLLIRERGGFPEETYHTFSYTPIVGDDGDFGGIFCPVTEDTQRIIGERQLALLRELAATAAQARTVDEACALAAGSLQTNLRDLPFALLYRVDPEQRRVQLAAASAVGRGHRWAPETAALDGDCFWPFGEAVETREICLVQNLNAQAEALPAGSWPRPPHQAVVVPIAAPGSSDHPGPMALLIVGLNPFRRYDDDYQGFINLIAGQLAASLAQAQASEAERQRAEALAALDRAKTAFFSNISHEFRTPLSLLLGPLDDVLDSLDGRIPPEARELLILARRNGQRLLKLVNTLLDFARIEAGRAQAVYEPVDLATYTAELASAFQAAMEKAGLRFVIDCPKLHEPVYVDRDMWEKIVLNLVSNAFKYTLEGEVRVSLRSEHGAAVLRVQDTGVGIPEAELPKIFQRFHRVEGPRGRAQEGTGIGLALVQELAKLHGGKAEVESRDGQGSTFTVTIPLRQRHPIGDRSGGDRKQASTALGAMPFVEEALRWLPDAETEGEAPCLGTAGPAEQASPSPHWMPRARILVADDNADFRQYLKRLLSAEYEVTAVSDGQQALQAVIDERPDLVLTDVMMPNLDGFGLLQKLRAEPGTASIPVILLSARAGEEARVEGLLAGADDYLTKPFGAKELLARIGGILALARARREARQREEELRAETVNVLESMAEGFIAVDREWRITYLNAVAERVIGLSRTGLLGRNFWDAFPSARGTRTERKLRRVMSERTPARFETLYAPDGRWFESDAYPTRNGGIAAYSRDITERKRAEARLRASEERLRRMFQIETVGIVSLGESGTIIDANDAFLRLTGYTRDDLKSALLDWRSLTPPEWMDLSTEQMRLLAATGRIGPYEKEYFRKDGSRSWLLFAGARLDDGVTVKFCIDISNRKRVERKLFETQQRLQAIMEATPVGISFSRDPRGQHMTGNPAALAQFELMPGDKFSASETDRCSNRPMRFFCAGQAITEQELPLQRAVAEQRVIPPMELEIELPSGRRWIAQASGAPILDNQGQVVGGVMVTVDITERKEFEKKLKDADRRKDEFLAMLAHELRNPLAPIRTGLQILRLARDDRGALEKATSMMERQLRHMIRLIDDLLDLSRISRGKIELRKSPVDLATILQHAVETSRPVIAKSGHELTISLPAEPILVEADVTRLAQAFANLLNNAAKYTENGGRISLTAERCDEDVVVRVKDNGIGIPSHMLTRVFDMFTQVDGLSKKAQGGLGIGLSLVKALVEMHGGSVEAHSDGPGQGSELVVRLKTLAARELEDPPPEGPMKASARRRLLIVDDNVDAATSLSMLTEILGHEVRTAHDGLEALDVAAAFRPELILLDIGMPKLNGYDTCRRIREESWGRNIVIAALTGWGQDGDRCQSRAAGFNHHLVKPVDPLMLRKLLASLSGEPAG